MDIAKIRKKALSKEAGDRYLEKPVAATEEVVEKAAEKEQETAGVKETPQIEMPGADNADIDESRPDISSAENGPDGDTGELVELLTFTLSNEEYAFRVNDVEEVLRMQTITMVPTMPDYLLGITSLRGKIIPVMDLRTRLNLQEKSLPTNSGDYNPAVGAENLKSNWMENKILIISGPRGMIGAAIDKVIGVVRLPLSGMLQPPGHLDERELRFIEGIVVIEKRFISIIQSDAAMDIEAG